MLRVRSLLHEPRLVEHLRRTGLSFPSFASCVVCVAGSIARRSLGFHPSVAPFPTKGFKASNEVPDNPAFISKAHMKLAISFIALI
jgi:hypothetical protein